MEIIKAKKNHIKKTKLIFKNLKRKVFKKYNSLMFPEVQEEKELLEYSAVDLGWELEKSETNDVTEFDTFYLNEKCVLKIKKLSAAEKYLVSLFLKNIEDVPSENLDAELETQLVEFCNSKNILLDNDQQKYLLEIIKKELFSFGPLSYLLESKDIEEIAINGYGFDKKICVYVINRGWHDSNLYFTNENYLRELVNKMSRNIGRRITLSSPILNASLKDGSRLNAIIKPVVNSGISITIRKFRFNPMTPLDLIKNNTISLDLAIFLALAMQSEINVLIAGNTGSGKTTLLNSLFSFVPLDERIIITEETPEINIPHNHKVCLKVNAEQKINMTDLIKTTLRMRPDRVIVGEIRTKEEVDAYLDTILAGQGKGSYATFHGLSVNETISRLKNFGLNEQDLNALDLIILQKRWTSIKGGQKIERRKLFEIAEIENSKVNILFKYNASKNEFEQVNESKKVKEKIELVFGKKYSVLSKDLRSYLEFLLSDKELKIDEFSKMFNSYILSE